MPRSRSQVLIPSDAFFGPRSVKMSVDDRRICAQTPDIRRDDLCRKLLEITAFRCGNWPAFKPLIHGVSLAEGRCRNPSGHLSASMIRDRLQRRLVQCSSLWIDSRPLGCEDTRIKFSPDHTRHHPSCSAALRDAKARHRAVDQQSQWLLRV